MFATHPLLLAVYAFALLVFGVVTTRLADGNAVVPSTERFMRAVKKGYGAPASLSSTAAFPLKLAAHVCAAQSLKCGIALAGDHATSVAVGVDVRNAMDRIVAATNELVEEHGAAAGVSWCEVTTLLKL